MEASVVDEAAGQSNTLALDSGSLSNILRQQSMQTAEPPRQHEYIPSNKAKTRLAPIELSSRTFAAFWLLLVALHAGHAAFLISCGRLYWYLEEPYLAYYADLIAPPEDRYFRFFGTVLGVLGGWNAIECLVMLFVSVRARKPALPPAGTLDVVFIATHWSLTRVLQSIRRHHERLHASRQSLQPDTGDPPTRGRLLRLIDQAFDLVSIESERFDSVFTVREIVVTATQVVQCYTYSSRIARPWINHVSVALVVANCVSVALLYRLLRRYDQFIKRASVRIVSFSSPSWRASPAFARLLCHVLDCLLTFAMSVVLPVAVFFPYLLLFDAEEVSFPLSLIYSDTEFPNMVRENQALFARTLFDVGVKLVPHISIDLCLIVMASVLRTRRDLRQPTSVHLASAAVRPTAEMISTTIQQAFAAATQNTNPPTSLQQAPTRRLHIHRRLRPEMIPWFKQKWAALLFLSTAIVVLSLHLQASLSNSAGRLSFFSPLSTSDSTDSTASTSTAVNMCALAIYPWFSSGASCAVVKYNCHRLGVSSPPSDAFASLDPSTVSNLIFTHCPLLVVPPAIQKFRNLLGLEIYNSTLVEWAEDAALTDLHHPDMVFLVLARVNLTELPPGVLHSPFPDKLGDIEISTTNLSVVPDSLANVWANVDVLFIEHSQFTEVPSAVLAIPALSELSMVGNQIVELPDDFSDLMEEGGRYLLALGLNPLTSLATRVKSGVSFAYLSLENTALTELPAWVADQVDEQVFAYGSPICEPVLESESSASDSREFLSGSDPVVVAACSSRDDSGDGYYPLALTDSMRPL